MRSRVHDENYARILIFQLFLSSSRSRRCLLLIALRGHNHKRERVIAARIYRSLVVKLSAMQFTVSRTHL